MWQTCTSTCNEHYGPGIFTGTSHELKDHPEESGQALGNVRSVLKDVKSVMLSGSTITNDAIVTAHFNYYPFGMPMPGRYNPGNTVSTGGYRYGFNGKEKDDDMAGTTGAVYDFGARLYDSRLGRWLSVDPLQIKFPEESPYNFVYNDVIRKRDIGGKYGEDGHYWTAYATALLLGLPNDKAIEYAVHAENFDANVINKASIQGTTFDNKGTYLPWGFKESGWTPFGGHGDRMTQMFQHGLGWKSAKACDDYALTKIFQGKLDFLHLLGDSKAHATEESEYRKMFPGIIGHTLMLTLPDNIGLHSDQFLKYEDEMINAISRLEQVNPNIDKTIFNIISTNTNKNQRNDILKGFIANRIGQSYETKYNKNVASAYDQLNIKYTFDKENNKIIINEKNDENKNPEGQ